MTRDDFDAWRKDEVTRWVFKGIAAAREQERAEWLRQSWESGNADQMQLIELKTRSDALGELVDNDFEIWALWNGEEIEQA